MAKKLKTTKKLKDLIINNLDVTVTQFCKEVGIARQTYENIMKESNGFKSKNGKEYRPSLLVTRKICNYFKVSVLDFWEE